MEIFEIPEVLSPMEISGIRSRNIPFNQSPFAKSKKNI
jgi:hypothetical protein